MIEEYRTERALCDSGTWPHDDCLAGFGDAVENLANAAWNGVNLRYDDEPIDRCCTTVLSAFHQLATYTCAQPGETLL
jgi:hypothetical protein